MKNIHIFCPIMALLASFSIHAQNLSPEEWGSPDVKVTSHQSQWIITGNQNKVILNEKDLKVKILAGPVNWAMAPSEPNDILVKWHGEKIYLSFSDATKKNFSVYKTGYKTGVKIRLENFHTKKNEELGLAVVLTVCLEGDANELVFNVMAIEKEATVRQLDWPKELESGDVDYTVLNHVRGNLLPRNWPHPYHPFRTFTGDQEAAEVTVDTTSVIVSNLVECWSQSWWGFQKGKSAIMLIVETPDDASYKFDHPAGGPTVIGPRWLASLGHFSYPRTVRMVFFEKGNYVTLAKRYRKYVMDIGQFVSLKEKITRNPLVEKLIGTPHYRQYALITGKSLRALPVLQSKPAGRKYNPDDPQKDYGLMTFDELAQELRELKKNGIDRLNATLCAWPANGYNMKHPDPLPPAPLAGGWEGMKRWAETCKELGYTSGLHDQYRDYYVNARSYNPDMAIHEEDSVSIPTAFPGSRFFGWKEGTMPVMDFWGGGKMAYMNPEFGLGHLKKNYEAMADHGIHLTGTYLDVFGYIPPTEDFSPEHPMTRTQSLKYRALCFNWVRNNLGITGTEDGADWIIPYVDFTSDGNEGSCISIPLYNLVYHDAILTPSGGRGNPLRCLLNAGFPWIGQPGGKEIDMDMLNLILALHKRLALEEMTNHEFLDNTFRREKTTFSDGTTVIIDRDAGTWEINPPLEGVISSGILPEK